MNPRTAGFKLLAALLAVALVTVALPARAEAHAVLVRSSPESQSLLATAPSSIDLWFSEPLEAAYTTFELYGSDGARLPVDGVRIDPDDRQHLSGLPQQLTPGIYTVVYRTLSQLDGHEWTGSFTFTVVNPDGSIPTGAAFDPGLGGTTDPGLVAGRWLTFAGFAVLVGLGLLTLLDARGRRRQRTPEVALLSRRLALAALPLLVGGLVLVLRAQHGSLGGDLTDLLAETRFGTIWLWRALIVLAIAAAVGLQFLAARRGRARAGEALIFLTTLLAYAGLLTVSLLSHAAAAPGAFWAVSVDFVHFALAAAWTGGLIGLVALFARRQLHRGSGATLLPLVGRFSVFAAVSVFLLGVTGVLRSLGELPTADALLDTDYGVWLIVKLVLIGALLGVALINRSLVRGYERGEDREAAARGLARMLPFEAILGVAVLFAVAALGQTPTPRGTDASAGAGTSVVVPYNAVQTASDLVMHLQVTPAAVGPNELRVHLYHQDGSAIGEVGLVQLTLRTFAAGGGGDVIEATPQGDDIFAATATFSNLSLDWQVVIDVRRGGQDDVRSEFRVPVQGGSRGVAGRDLFGSPAPQLSRNTLWAVLLAAAGLGLVLWFRRRASATGTFGRLGGAGAIFVGVVLAVSAEQPHGGQFFTNPNPGDPASIERGAALYFANCASCHGETGQGDGPAAVTLNPPPANFTLHIPLHGDGDVYVFIANGLAGTAMPAWREELSEDQIWDLVNYLRSQFDTGAPALQ